MVPVLLFTMGVAGLFAGYREVMEALERLKDNFPRGGPPRPMHPSPVNDARLLLRRRAKT